jgi:quercetin dioxygenase-like cupin family protein
MTAGLTVRRVVTGHAADGKAVVLFDETLEASTPRPGHQVCAVWGNATVPADNGDPRDGALIAPTAHLPGGATFRIVQHAPGAESRMHRTRTLDYGVVLSGAIVLELDDGLETTLTAGDLLVQRGTIHRWVNRGQEPCIMGFVLLDAAPLDLGEADA